MLTDPGRIHGAVRGTPVPCSVGPGFGAGTSPGPRTGLGSAAPW